MVNAVETHAVDEKTVQLINLTPHAVCFYTNHDDPAPSLVIPSSGVARVETVREIVEYVVVDGVRVPIGVTTFMPVVFGLLPPAPNTRYIVSAPVLNALPHRTDLLVPMAHVRGVDGRVVGCAGFDRLSKAEKEG